MPFPPSELRLFADARGQTVVLAVVCGRECGLMIDAPDASLNDLTQSLSTGDWQRWSFGELEAFDRHGQRLDDGDCPQEWGEIQPVEFREVSEVVAAAPAAKGDSATVERPAATGTASTRTKPKPKTKPDTWPPKLRIVQRDDGCWWITGGRSGATEHGPYDSRKDADEDRAGLARFYASLKEHER